MRKRLAVLALLVCSSLQGHPGSAIAVGANGVVYFVDTGGGVFTIDARGTMQRIPGPAFHWFAFDPSNRFANTRFPYIPGSDFHAGSGVVLSSDYPAVITTDGSFNYAQSEEGARPRIQRLTPDGRVSTRATLPGGVRWVNGMAAGRDNSIYYTEDSAVRKLDARGVITTLAERVTVTGCIDVPSDEPTPKPYLRGLAVADDGTVYVAAAGCGALLRLQNGRATVILRTQAPWSPTAVAVSGSDIYVLEYLHTPGDDRRQWLPRVRKIAKDGKVSTLALVTKRCARLDVIPSFARDPGVWRRGARSSISRPCPTKIPSRRSG